MLHFWNLYQDIRSRDNENNKNPHYARHGILNRLTIFPTAHAISSERMKEMMEEYRDILEYKPEDDPFNKMTGVERVKRCWHEVFLGTRSWELDMIMNLWVYSSITGFIYGTVKDSDTLVKESTKRFNEMAFEHDYLGRRKLMDYAMVQTSLNGFKAAWRLALFPTYMACFAVSSMAYRNDVYPPDFAASAGLAAAVYKFPLGPRAMLVAGGAMSIFGLLGGYLVKAGFYVSGYTYPEFRFFSNLREVRSREDMSSRSWERFRRKREELMSEEEKALLQRDKIIKEMKSEARQELIHKDFFTPEAKNVQTTQSNVSQAENKTTVK